MVLVLDDNTSLNILLLVCAWFSLILLLTALVNAPVTPTAIITMPVIIIPIICFVFIIFSFLSQYKTTYGMSVYGFNNDAFINCLL